MWQIGFLLLVAVSAVPDESDELDNVIPFFSNYVYKNNMPLVSTYKAVVPVPVVKFVQGNTFGRPLVKNVPHTPTVRNHEAPRVEVMNVQRAETPSSVKEVNPGSFVARARPQVPVYRVFRDDDVDDDDVVFGFTNNFRSAAPAMVHSTGQSPFFRSFRVKVDDDDDDDDDDDSPVFFRSAVPQVMPRSTHGNFKLFWENDEYDHKYTDAQGNVKYYVDDDDDDDDRKYFDDK